MRYLQSFCLLALTAVAGAQQTFSLSDAIQAARANRPAYESARLRVAEANHSRRALGTFPTTSLSIGYTSDDEVGGSDDDLVLTQPLDIFGRTSAARAAGNALVIQAEASLKRVAGEVQAEVVEAYVEAAASAELARSAAIVQATLQNLYEATRLRVEGGIAPGIQLTRVGVELDQAKLRTEQRQAELQANLRRLATMIGTPEAPRVSEGFPMLPFEIQDEAALLKQRPDLLVLAADLKAAEAEARSSRLGNMPLMELQARRTPWQQTDARYGLRLQLSIPLYDHGRVRSETKAASTKAEALRKSLQDATKLATGEIEASRIEVEAARDQVTKYEALAVTARQLVERLRPGLTEQATTLLEVIDATRSMKDVEEGLVEARHRLAQAQSRYLKASGQILEVAK